MGSYESWVKTALPSPRKSENQVESLDSEISRLDRETAIYSNTITTIEKDSKKTIQAFNNTIGSIGRQLNEPLSQMARSLEFYFWTIIDPTH